MFRLTKKQGIPRNSCGAHLGFSSCAISEAGQKWSGNEDNYVLEGYMNGNCSDRSEASAASTTPPDAWRLAGVFDGIGGGDYGDVASRETARIFLDAFNTLRGTPSKTEVDLVIRRAFLQANNAIDELRREYLILGSTGTVVCSNGRDYKIYHLGDTRAYLLHGSCLSQLTKDQTLAQMKLDAGMYRLPEAIPQGDQQRLTEYIGRDRTREHLAPEETGWGTLYSGDTILLCSDGLHRFCGEAEIRGILMQNLPTYQKTSELIQAALKRGSTDNITCAVISFL